MSGIVGLMDRDGVDLAEIREAASAAKYRGEISVRAVGHRIAVGTFARNAETRRVSADDAGVLVFDGRIDAVIRSPFGVMEDAGDSLGFLHRRLMHEGPGCLNRFAAEFALAEACGAPEELLLARDAWGLHPLFVAARGRRVAFASDPALLVALGVASDDLDTDAVASYLARYEPTGGQTAFRQIREVEPGGWLRFDADGRRTTGRWFNPESLQGPILRGEEAVGALQEAVAASVRSRTTGRRVAIALSGGMDSGSVAVAVARSGIDAVAITQRYDADLQVNEDHLARQVCERLDMPWMVAPVPSMPDSAVLAEIPEWSGTPLTYFASPEATALPDVAAEAGVDVVLTGEGEALFATSEIAVLDLLRGGRPIAALRAARQFRSHWGMPYARQFKVGVRAHLPPSVLAARERVRAAPPWIRGDVSRTYSAPQSDRDWLLQLLRAPVTAGFDLDERLFQTRGLEVAHPFLDLRVLSVALSVPLVDRAPIRQPKPLLGRSFLGDLASSRVKMSFTPYYRRLARCLQRGYPHLFAEDSFACAAGILDPGGLRRAPERRWLVESLGVVGLELWLRRGL